MTEDTKIYEHFFDKDVGKSLIREIESELLYIADKKVIQCWSTLDENFIECFSYDGQHFGTKDRLGFDGAFEKAKKANFEYFKRCLIYKWVHENKSTNK